MKRIIIFVCWFISVGCLSEADLIQRASAHLAKISEAKPVTGKLEKLIVADDAKFTLLHIRQQHYSDIYTAAILNELKNSRSDLETVKIKSRYLEVLRKTDLVQKEISEFLLSVCDKKDVIYSEGLPFPTTYREKFVEEYLDEIKKEVMQVVSYRNDVNFLYPQPPYFAGASIFLKKHHDFTVFGVEHSSLLELILSTYENDKLAPSLKSTLIRECHAEREKQMLINMADELDDLAYLEPSLKLLICGSKHDFRDDVELWNKENPMRKYNLLIFTPNTLKEK